MAHEVAIGLGGSLAIGALVGWVLPRNQLVGIALIVVAVVCAVFAAARALRSPNPMQVFGRLAAMTALGVGVALLVSFAAPESSAEADASDVTLLRDPRADCGRCPASQDILGMGVRVAGRRTRVGVELDAPPQPGDQIWVWLPEVARSPVVLERTAGGWQWILEANDAGPTVLGSVAVEDRGREVTLVLHATGRLGSIAITTPAGDRAPNKGEIRNAATVAPMRGVVAARVEVAMAQAQAGVGKLDPVRRALALVLLGRQLGRGTVTYDLQNAASPRGETVVTTRYPELGVDFLLDINGRLQLARTQLVLADKELVCSADPEPDGNLPPTSCRAPDQSITEPVDLVLAMLRAPEAVSVERSPDRVLRGRSAHCFRISAAPPGGPALGEACAFTDGTFAFLDDPHGGQQFRLTDTSPVVDRARLAPSHTG